MRFRKYRGMSLTYEQQGLVFFICRNYEEQPKKIQEKILRLCQSEGGSNPYALFLLLTTGQSVQSIMEQFKIASETTMYDARNRFYRAWCEEAEHEQKQ